MNFVSKIKENPLLSLLIILLILLGIVFVVVLCFENPKRIFNLLGVSEKEQPKYEVLKFLGIGMGGILVALQALMSYKRAKAMEDTASHTEQGLRQERLKNAIEHLGHEKDSVRLGGAYELFHLAEDNKDLKKTAFDMLCLHIRQTTGEDEYQKKHKYKPSEEVQSLLTLLFVQEHEVFKDLQINLQGSWLNGADLREARLEKAILTEGHLQGANLSWAHLQGADLHRARLQGIFLIQAHLQGAHLIQAHLQGTDLPLAHLRGADFKDAQLQGTDLCKAHLQGAFLDKVRLQEASLDEAHLQGATNLAWVPSFRDRIRNQIGKETDLSGAVFAGGLTKEDVDSLVEGLSDEKANELREKLEPHIGKPVSNELPENSGAIIGFYTEEEAEKWIAEYEKAMLEVPEDDS